MKHFKYFWIWCRNQKILFTVFVVALVIPNVVFFFTEYTSLLTRIINITFAVSVFWFMMTLTKKPGKMMWIFFLFIFFNAFQMVLLHLFGQAVIAVDMFLNLATTNSGEASELILNILPAMIAVCLLYIIILTLAAMSILNKKTLKKGFILRQRKMSLSLLSLTIIGIGVNYVINSDFRMLKDIYPINVCYNVVLAVDRDIKTQNYAETSKYFHYDATSSHAKEDKEIYIYVIGETARALNFGVYGYARNTTPELSKIKDLLIYRDALTQSNTTHKSVPMLMSGVSADNYDDIYSQKSIITAYKEVGFSTAFFSNQRPNNSFIDFFANEADKTVFVKGNLPSKVNILDSELLIHVKKELDTNKSNKIFIVLHTYGSHFNYYERYPKSFAKFAPDSVISASAKHRDRLINAYDNSIVYTDDLLGQLIEMVDEKASTSAVLYLSDHGEDIHDDQRDLFLHASPVPSVYQLHVPYIIWFSDIYKQKYPQIIDAAKANVNKAVSTNVSAFHTLLDISGINTNNLNKTYSVVDPSYTVRQRVYLNDHNKPMPLNKIGLTEEDEIVFKKCNLVYP